MNKNQNMWPIKNFNNYLWVIEEIIWKIDVSWKKEYILPLYRWQSEDFPLLPSIARMHPEINTSINEKKSIEELKRRSGLLLWNNYENNWDLLVLIQHHWLKTRLLDWTTNPLVALWFACNNEKKRDQDSYVYIFLATEDYILDDKLKQDPWELSSTKILKPNQNNNRIIAQSGWFTAHPFSSTAKKFVNLTTHRLYWGNVFKLRIPANQKEDILKKLNIFGINFQSMFPDLEWFCKQINWEFNL